MYLGGGTPSKIFLGQGDEGAGTPEVRVLKGRGRWGNRILLQEEDYFTVERTIEDDPETVCAGKTFSTDPGPSFYFFLGLPSFVYWPSFLPGDFLEIRGGCDNLNHSADGYLPVSVFGSTIWAFP